MNNYASRFFRSLLMMTSLTALAAIANAQSSLVFRDSAGRVTEFTNFGTIVYPNQNIVSRGYEVVYNDGSGLKRAWYLNGLNNFGIIPVSLSADRPNGYQLDAGERVYVRSEVTTGDKKLKITCRFILKDGSPGIEAIVTVANTSNSSIDVGEVSIVTPYSPECSCPCEPVREFDGSTLQLSIVTIAPNLRYRRTKAVFTSPALGRSESRDLPGCDQRPDVPNLPIN